MFKDEEILFEENECLKKLYLKKKLKAKMIAICDYYKFHVEIPRVYMLPISYICNRNNWISDFHDKKRRINYYRVKLIMH